MRRYTLNFFSTDWGINNGKNNGFLLLDISLKKFTLKVPGNAIRADRLHHAFSRYV